MTTSAPTPPAHLPTRTPTPTPTRRHWLRLATGLAALGSIAPLGAMSPEAAGLCWDRRLLVGFGTTLSLLAADRDATRLARALDAAVATLQRIEAQMSLFRGDSALSVLNRDGRLDDAPAELLEVLATAQRVSQASDGAFDATVQPLWLAFALAQQHGRLPTREELGAARALVDWRGVIVAGRRVRLARPGMGITLNGIAQGYAADRVRAVLDAHGIAHALVDAGEFAMRGRDREGARWTLGVADPRDEHRVLARLFADGRCVATSSDAQVRFSADGRHHHILDPHTGDSPPALAGVTVAAGDGAIADALTKVFFVAGPERAADVAQRWGVDALWIDKRGAWHASPGLAFDARA
jgi:thiamine biosynthesis lipoprotein